MALLRYFPAQGRPLLLPVTKPLVTVGRSADNDVRLAERDVLDHHAQLLFTGRDFELETLAREAPLEINGKSKRRARLVHGDRLKLGSAELTFSMFGELPEVVRPEAGTRQGTDLVGLRRLQEFSSRLMTVTSVDELLATLLDQVLEFTGAVRGLVLWRAPGTTTGRPEVRAARHIKPESIADASGQLSDSIVREVIETGRPLIVSDASSDTVFGKSESVLALRLSSVMCAPLFANGEVVGALYVANDEIKSLFERAQLDVLTVFASQASLILQNALLVSALRADKEKLSQELAERRLGELVGACPSMTAVFRSLQKVAPIDVSVLVTGETGTGKELIARELHRRSPRASGPFVAVNCGAIPENLIESELFGHARGAFTGAIASRPGRFQQADRGTLFLDEIGELPVALQVKLLRALQERVVTRLGESRPESCDIRVIAATHRDLLAMIAEGTFREDLYYRLNVVTLALPPLRERGDDISILAKVFLTKFADELKSPVRGFSAGAMAALQKHAWPGNIRELENRIRRALVLCESTLIDAKDLGLGPEALCPLVPLERAKEDFQRQYVLAALARNNGNRTQTARDLGVDPRTVFRYLENEPRGSDPGAPNE